MKVTTFDPAADLIIVPGRVWGVASNPIELRLVLDTGAAETILEPHVIDDLGYSAREHGEQIAVMRSAAGHEHGYMIRVARFACLGFQETSFRVHAQDLPEGWGIDGLVGLSFLRGLNYEVRSLEGRIRVERAGGQALTSHTRVSWGAPVEQRTIIFTQDNHTAYEIARQFLVYPITHEIGRRERATVLERFNSGEIKVLVSSQVLDEGFDVPDAEVAIVVGGSASERRYVQRIGRVLRPSPGKRARVYEMTVAESIEVEHARRRRRGILAVAELPS